MTNKETYAQSLEKGRLSTEAIGNILEFMGFRGMSFENLPAKILNDSGYRPKLELKLCRGNPNWEGLVVGFPGTKKDLTTQKVGTPYLRRILYQILIIQRELGPHYSRPMRCLYIVGDRFNDVFIRKFSFFNSLVPHVIVLSEDLRKWADRKTGHEPKSTKGKIDENYIQKNLCDRMKLTNGLHLPSSSGKDKDIRVGFLSYEVPTVLSAIKTERLDILGYDLDDHSLIAIEIKRPDADRPERENLFFQGLEHRNWLEENTMAVKFAMDGPRGNRINVRKRVKLVLGLSGVPIPKLFPQLRKEAVKRDRHLQIKFCRLIKPSKFGENVAIESYPD